MTEYVTGIFAAVAVLGILRLLAYKERGDGARKFAFAILIMYVTVMPLSDAIRNFDGDFSFDSTDFTDSEYGEEYLAVAEEAFRTGVHSLICDKFSFSEDDVRVLIEDFDFENMRAGKIRVFLSGKAALGDYKAIEKYVSENGLGECDAEIEIG